MNKKLRNRKKVNRLKFIDDIKLFAKDENELETLTQTMTIYSLDIGMEFGIEKCVKLIMKSEKRHMTEGMELPNQEKNQNTQRKGNLQITGNIESGHQ